MFDIKNVIGRITVNGILRKLAKLSAVASRKQETGLNLHEHEAEHFFLKTGHKCEFFLHKGVIHVFRTMWQRESDICEIILKNVHKLNRPIRTALFL
jgi:hypothetical protein